MIAQVHFDMREFNKALKESIAKSSRIPSVVVNSQAYALAVRALNMTHRASLDRIAWQLGQIATSAHRLAGKKGAKVFVKRKKPKRIFAEKDTFAHRIVNARRRDAGKPLLFGDKLESAVNKLRAARFKSINFIRSGWLAPIRKLASVLKEMAGQGTSRPDPDAKQKGKPKGGAIPAPPLELRAVCQIFNSAILPKSQYASEAGNPMAVAEAGLAKAASESVRDMRKHIENKVKEIIVAHSAK